jgi:hypothetical protein
VEAISFLTTRERSEKEARLSDGIRKMSGMESMRDGEHEWMKIRRYGDEK